MSPRSKETVPEEKTFKIEEHQGKLELRFKPPLRQKELMKITKGLTVFPEIQTSKNRVRARTLIYEVTDFAFTTEEAVIMCGQLHQKNSDRSKLGYQWKNEVKLGNIAIEATQVTDQASM